MTPTIQHVTASGARTAETWLPFLQSACKTYEINTPNRIAGFLAQIAHESAGFTLLTENLNYSAERLMAIWPRRFSTIEFARQYGRQPEKIANLVYANRMGNGDEASGEGWKYRGRGLKQLTGKFNYDACSKALNEDFLTSPEKLLMPVNAALSAGWFWDENGLNRFADADDFVGMTKRINGGTIGLEDRQARYKRILAAMK